MNPLRLPQNYFSLQAAGYIGIAGRFPIGITGRNHRNIHAAIIEPQLQDNQGRIILLPEISDQEQDSIDVLLKHVLKVSAPQSAPGWIQEMLVPGEEFLEEEIIEIKREIEETMATWESLLEQRSELRKPLALLYETGNYFEVAVRDAFQTLGAQVRENEVKEQEDGWIKYKDFEFVLEAKTSIKEAFGKKGARQLFEWVKNGIQDEGKTYKGLFVGIADRYKPPEDRGDAYVHLKIVAERAGFVLLDGWDLYRCLEMHHKKKLDIDEFFEKLFKTKGLFDVAPFLN